ncbi:hypothetical protein [Streptomyces marianii]|uniref:Uncharacterized protein n=1 Tax=Streptomyces marianii TaxID=1817406 RepID=A0A5R9DSE4_9ACTN|nr:hypothetical protein [Streptomyces marianii]TLQ39429.1 hypothetical protein FEF34_39320 [Streptomyces marianii]
MGRYKLKKQRRSRFQADGRPVDEACLASHVAAVADTVDDHGRVTFWDDPALQLGQVASGIDPESGAVTVDPGESGQLPAALFEPARALMIKAPGEPPREQQAEAAIQLGMERFGLGFAVLRPADGWALHRLADERLELRSPDGGVFSRIAVPFNPAWISSALSTGFVLCLYGIQLGVRTPPGMPAGQYTDGARLEEFRRGRGLGFTAAGLVSFVNNRG